MPIVRFIGRVYPTAANINFNRTVGISWGSSDLGFPIEMSATVVNSVVEASCHVPHFEESHTSILLGRALNLVEAITDLSAFGMGLALWVDFETIIKPDGMRETLLKSDPSLKPLCTAFVVPPRNPIEQLEFENVLRLVLADPALMGSLRDLAQVLQQFSVTPINCGRVLDTLRRAVAPGYEKKTGWEILRKIVNADGHYMKWISVYSTEPRHGDRTTDIPMGIVMEMRRRTWEVVNRYIAYKIGGNRPLDTIRFSLLVHDPGFAFPPKP